MNTPLVNGNEHLNMMLPILELVKNVAAFELPSSTQEKLEKLIRLLNTTPRPEIITRLTVEGGSKRDWLTPFLRAATGHVQEGLSASYYHLSNVESIEQRLTSGVSDIAKTTKLIDQGTIAVGNTRQLNFEYQAFVFALRRTMEYLAVSVGAFFKKETNRIRKLESSIADAAPEDLRDSVCEKLRQLLPELNDILAPGDNKHSVRDQLAHWKSVDAGCLNMIIHAPNKLTIGILGGGENLRPWDSGIGPRMETHQDGPVAIMRLTQTLHHQINRVEILIFGLYSAMGFNTES